MGWSSEAVARGNLKVFAEIGRAFAFFNAGCLKDAAFDAAHIEEVCEALLPGEPPDGQMYLRQAFSHYYQALFEPDPKARSELVLLANLEIGYHEQTRLQPEINEALAAPVIVPETFTRNLLRALRPDWGRLNDLVWFFLRLLGRLTDLDAATTCYLTAAQREAQLIVTKTMMTIELPHGNLLRLGRDLGADYPPELRQITNRDLLELLARIDPTTDSLKDFRRQTLGGFTRPAAFHCRSVSQFPNYRYLIRAAFHRHPDCRIEGWSAAIRTFVTVSWSVQFSSRASQPYEVCSHQ